MLCPGMRRGIKKCNSDLYLNLGSILVLENHDFSVGMILEKFGQHNGAIRGSRI